MANPAGTPTTNPFDNAFEMLGQPPEVTTESVNSEALDLLTEALTTRAGQRGRMILLRSPRAGFGKTHLLARLYRRVAHSHEFISLEPSKGRYLDAPAVLDAVLRRFSRVLPAGGGLTVLDLLARRILAAGLEPLVKSGEVPSQDRNSALLALQQRPVETFDFHNEDAVTARWAQANFSLLGPRLTAELAERTRSGFRPVAWWVELLFRYSSAEIDQTCRNSSLFETVFGGNQVETDMHEKLVTLLNLTGLVTSPVLVLDEVEGFSSNPEAALQVATFLNALHQSCSKLALIISVNGDVWETAFQPRIPCGLKDRLSDIVVDLEPMDKDAAVELLRDRAGDRAEAIVEAMDFDSGVVYARGLIREAAKAWEKLAAAAAEEAQTVEQAPISQDEPEEKAQEPEESVNPSGEEDVKVPADVPLSASEPPAEDLVNPEDVAGAQPERDDVQSAEVPEAEQEALAEPAPSEPEPAPQPAPFKPEPTPQPEPPLLGQPEPAPEQPEPRPVTQTDPARPFANNPPQESKSEPPYFGPPKEEAVQPFVPVSSAEPEAPQASQSVVEPKSPFSIASDKEVPQVQPPQREVKSPFSIDVSVAAPPSPFQPEQPGQQPAPAPQPVPQPVKPVLPEQQPGFASAASQPQPAAPVPGSDSPFRVDDGKASPPEVTQEDHERVEDLLKQFRNRYGRD